MQGRDENSHEEFDNELEYFSSKVGIIVSLELGGKMSPGDAYVEIKRLWKSLKKLKKQTLPNAVVEVVTEATTEQSQSSDP